MKTLNIVFPKIDLILLKNLKNFFFRPLFLILAINKLDL